MVKSKTKIEKQTKRKSNSGLVETIISAKKCRAWFRVAEILSGPKKNRVEMNLGNINTKTKQDETVLIAGKVLSQGEITKKIKVVALSFSEKAKEKLLKSGCEISSIIEEIKKNPEAKGVKTLNK